MSQKNKYKLSTAGKRIGVNTLDYLLIIGISILVTYVLTFFLFDQQYQNLLAGQHSQFSAMLLTSFGVNCLIWWGHFVLVPYLWKGYTLFGRALKTKIHWTEKERLLSRLTLYQAVPVAGVYFNTLVIVLVSFAFDDPVKFISSIFTLNSSNGADTWVKMAAGVLLASAVILSFPTLGIVVNIVINSNTTSILDETYKFFMIDANSSIKEVKITPPPKKTDLPGLIDIDELERL